MSDTHDMCVTAAKKFGYLPVKHCRTCREWFLSGRLHLLKNGDYNVR